MRTTVALAAALALGIFTVPLAGDAQQATKLWRVGHLGYARTPPPRKTWKRFGIASGISATSRGRTSSSSRGRRNRASSDCLSWRPSSSV
jgi:hypothetical protein